jgi:hypothetical protein
MSEGHFVCYVPKNFRSDALDTIAVANKIIEEYEGQGVPMSLRQLYYQMVARNLIPNKKGSYDKLGALINDGRMGGHVSWTAIEDRNRQLMGYQTFNGPEAAIAWLQSSHYRTDMWANQAWRPEVWVEKAALEGVIGQICNELRVDFFACRGYNSQSEQWRAGRRLAGYIGKGQRPIIFHLGDHDPSGLDMTRDNQERLSLFAGTDVQVVRLALNMDQVTRFNLPPNPAKMTDARYGEYRKEFGEQSWELDALEPTVIQGLIQDAVLRIRDDKLWDEALKQEAEDKIVLQELSGGDDSEDVDSGLSEI